ncbi:hypothetical protein pW2_38 [Bacillus phage pW2]|uniref:Uncharacterized protein n=1 Tax=Bacillus phage pW2 TaxID=2500559 RepID=A0A3T0IHM3_9CAUD|nr:hypothetical protein PQE69_gp023 [Bacillus phage pW2]AZU98876.1 hypothetical protein pW2_38 [Bacillus phage pW2]
MFKDWTDEKLKEEIEDGLRGYAVKKKWDKQNEVVHYDEQIAEKMKEINQLQWEREVSLGDIAEWDAVIARIDALVPPVVDPTPETGE